MAEYVKEFKFKNPIKEITYYDGESLKLTNEFCFFHNKNRFRNELTRLQKIFQNYLKTPLLVAGIRDSYIKEEYSENYLIILFTTHEIVKEVNKIVEISTNKDISAGCFYLETSTKYMLLLARDMKGLELGIDIMEQVLKQTLEHYLAQKKFNDYIQIRPFSMNNCIQLI